MKFDTIKDAAREWVGSFNAIPMGIVEKLIKAEGSIDDAITEVTPPSDGDHVYIYDCNKYGGSKYGEIVGVDEEDDESYLILLDGTNETISLSKDFFEVERDEFLPMWGTMWAFGEQIDNEWLGGQYLGNHLQEMADCGFRIYEQEDYEYIFGIDGAGYDFYESHWIPLYKARGLHWHKDAEEVAE